jgi:predicted signal transduction protein with EAL and GGDEF domain
LQAIASRLKLHIRESDTLARMGGDEFTVLLTGLEEPAAAEQVAAKLAEIVGLPLIVEGRELRIGASVGIAVAPEDGADAATLLKNGDTAMYFAKSSGRNCWRRFHGDMSAGVLEAALMEAHIRRGLDEGWFEVHYQPFFGRDRAVCGLEALVRLRHPKLGLLAPNKFIPVAEDTGLIIPLGHWVLRDVCRQITQWDTCGYLPLRVAVNVSAMQFADPLFANTVEATLAEFGVAPDRIELELTERVILGDVEQAARQMRRLRTIGVKLSIDDFGTGYSSLAYLHQLPLDTLKIDGSFVRQIESGGNALPVIRTIIALAASMGFRVVAEGVETSVQYEALEASGCDCAQGFLFSRPLLAADVEREFLAPAVLAATME